MLLSLEILKMTFNLNNKTIQYLIKTKSLYSESKQNYNKETNESSTIRFYNNNEPFIVQIIDAEKFDQEEYSGILINDGNSELFCLINSELIDKVQIKSGDVIIINEIICLNLEDNPADFKIAIAIHKCWNIGHSELKTKIYSDHENDLETKNFEIEKVQVTNNIDNDVIEAISIEKKLYTHLIKDLLPSIIKYTIRAKLCDKTVLNEFLTNSGTKRSKIRFQFADESSYIELACFGEFAEKYQSLIINETYFISMAIINTNISCRAWPRKPFLCKYDLLVNYKTTIILDESENYLKLIDENKNVSNNSITNKINNPITEGTSLFFRKRNLESTSMDFNQDKNKITKMTKAQNEDKSVDKKDKRIQFEDLLQLPNNSNYNILGILVEICEPTSLKRQGKSELYIRKMKIINKNRITLGVTFWGDQAKKIKNDYNIGAVLMFLSVKLTNYGGLSMSVERNTSVCLIPESYPDDEVIKLRGWWRSNKLTSTDFIPINRLVNQMKNN